MRNSTNNNSSTSSVKNNNSKYVTTTTVTDHNKVPRVEKVVFDNRIKRKNVLALNEKVAAIREYEKRPVYKRIGRMFQCSPDQIKRIVQQKDTILTAWEQRTRKSRDAKTLEMKVVRVSMLGKAVYEWIRRMMYYKDILITDGLIQKMALQFKSAMGLQNFFPHPDWCDKFRSTYKIFTCDSKALNIAYAQGHSVQIKDVMKDVLSECCPDEGDVEENEVENIDDLDDDDDDLDDDSGSMDSDGGGGRTNVREKPKATMVTTKEKSNQVIQQQPSGLSATMQGLRQLVALPIQGNGMTGMGQKVLVATPIVGPGQKQGAGPMTMTIIPLATLGQPHNGINRTQMVAQQLNATFCNRPATGANNNNSEDIPIPPPIIEIKKEIKEEPKDEDSHVTSLMEQDEDVKIKREYITDDEEDCNSKPTTACTTPMMMSSRMPTLLPAHVVSIPIHNRDMLEDSSKDSMDDLTLSSLKKRMKIEELSADEQEDAENRNNLNNQRTSSSSPSPMPPMPPLTKAPTLHTTATSLPPVTTPQSTTTTSASSSSSANCQTTVGMVAKACRKRASPSNTPYNNNQDLPAIRSCSEARKYLKLLEDFALERENFRLIGLITRADEVLRELDRKESNEGENEDVDVD